MKEKIYKKIIRGLMCVPLVVISLLSSAWTFGDIQNTTGGDVLNVSNYDVYDDTMIGDLMSDLLYNTIVSGNTFTGFYYGKDSYIKSVGNSTTTITSQKVGDYLFQSFYNYGTTGFVHNFGVTTLSSYRSNTANEDGYNSWYFKFYRNANDYVNIYPMICATSDMVGSNWTNNNLGNFDFINVDTINSGTYAVAFLIETSSPYDEYIDLCTYEGVTFLNFNGNSNITTVNTVATAYNSFIYYKDIVYQNAFINDYIRSNYFIGVTQLPVLNFHIGTNSSVVGVTKNFNINYPNLSRTENYCTISKVKPLLLNQLYVELAYLDLSTDTEYYISRIIELSNYRASSDGLNYLPVYPYNNIICYYLSGMYVKIDYAFSLYGSNYHGTCSFQMSTTSDYTTISGSNYSNGTYDNSTRIEIPFFIKYPKTDNYYVTTYSGVGFSLTTDQDTDYPYKRLSEFYSDFMSRTSDIVNEVSLKWYIFQNLHNNFQSLSDWYLYDTVNNKKYIVPVACCWVYVYDVTFTVDNSTIYDVSTLISASDFVTLNSDKITITSHTYSGFSGWTTISNSHDVSNYTASYSSALGYGDNTVFIQLRRTGEMRTHYNTYPSYSYTTYSASNPIVIRVAGGGGSGTGGTGATGISNADVKKELGFDMYTLFIGIVTAPIKILSDSLDFTFMGVNIKGMVFGILTVLLVIVVIKIVLKFVGK